MSLKNMSLKKLFLITAVVLGAASATQAQAQVWGGYNSGFYGGLPYSVYVLDSLPYYALHPPVYYSHIVPRPYGYSPYAYPPGIMTPDRPPGTPQVIHNPHAHSPAKPGKTEDRVTQVEPVTILNPFVSAEADVVGTPVPAPRRGKPAPKTIRPTSLAKAENKLAG